MPFDDVVPNCEIMRVGGYSTVRGYSEGCAWGKSGYTAKAEIHFMYTENAGSLYVFVDHAGVFPYPDIDDHFLLSCGVGTGFQIGNFFSMNIGLGIKAIEIYQDKGSASERGYFSVTVSI